MLSNINTPLLSISGQGEIFRELLKVEDIDVNIRNNDNESVLFRAVENCNKQFFLIETN